MTLLQVQGFSSPPASVRWTGGGAMVLAVIVISVLLAASLLLVSDWRRFREGEGATLAEEAERWLRGESPD